MQDNSITTNTHPLIEGFVNELVHAHALGVEDGSSTTDYRTAWQFAEGFKNRTPAEHLPALPEDTQDRLKEMIRDGELAGDDEVVGEYCAGFAEGCAKALEQMRHARRAAR